MKLFVYQGSTPIPLEHSDGGKTKEVKLVPGETVSLPADMQRVKSMLAKGLLKEAAEEMPKEKPVKKGLN
jgi:hypothetical protein